MRNARMTVLMTTDEKAEIESDAERLGVSSGEYIRLAVSNFEKPTAAEEAELAALVFEVNKAIPKMEASLDEISRKLRETHAEVDKMLRQMGARE